MRDAKKGGILANVSGNEKGNLKKIALDLGMAFVIVVLCILVVVFFGPYVFPLLGRVLNFIFNRFEM